MVLLATLAALGLALPQPCPQDASVQISDAFVELRVEADDPIVSPPGLTEAWSTRFPHRGVTLRLRPARDGLHYLEVRSYYIVPHLLVRDAAGATLLEQDDGQLGIIEVDLPALAAGAEFELLVVSRDGLPGPFSLRISEGYPADYVPTPEIAWTRAYLEQGPRAVEAAGGEPLSLALAWYRHALLLAYFGELDAALEAGSSACRAAEARPDHPQAFEILSWAGLTLTNTGRYAEGERWNRIAIAGAERTLGREHALLAAPLANLGTCAAEQGRYAEGLALLERAIAIQERAGGDAPTLRTMLENLAYIHVHLEQNADAERTIARGLELGGEDEASSQAAMARLLNIGAQVDSKAGRYEAALVKLDRACALGEDGAQRRTYQNSLNQRGEALIRLGRLPEAEEVLRRALRVSAEPGTEPSDAGAVTEYYLADVCRQLGRYEEARERFERALALMRESLGPQHPFIATCLDGLGNLLDNLGLVAEADTRTSSTSRRWAPTTAPRRRASAIWRGSCRRSASSRRPAAVVSNPSTPCAPASVTGIRRR